MSTASLIIYCVRKKLWDNSQPVMNLQKPQKMTEKPRDNDWSYSVVFIILLLFSGIQKRGQNNSGATHRHFSKQYIPNFASLQHSLIRYCTQSLEKPTAQQRAIIMLSSLAGHSNCSLAQTLVPLKRNPHNRRVNAISMAIFAELLS